MDDLVLTFTRGRAREVKIKRMAYVGKTSTLATWLFNFCVKRATGRHLRDDLPSRQRSGGGNGELPAFADVTPRDSPRDGETPRSSRMRFFRFGVGSLKAPFAFEGVEVTLRSKHETNEVKNASRNGSDSASDGGTSAQQTTSTTKKAMSKNKWRLIKGAATFIDVTVISFVVRDDDEPEKDVFFCDKISMDASGSTSTLKSLITGRVVRGNGGAWGAMDTNIHLVAAFDQDTKSVVLEHAAMNGASLTIRSTSDESTSSSSSPSQRQGQQALKSSTSSEHVARLLKVPRKCKIEFKRVILERKTHGHAVKVAMVDMKSSVERMSSETTGWFRKREAVSPFTKDDFAGDVWSALRASATSINVIHGDHQHLADVRALSATVNLALDARVLRDDEKLPATAIFSVDSCDFRHHPDAASLLAALKGPEKTGSTTNGHATTNDTKRKHPWNVVDAQATCTGIMRLRGIDEDGQTAMSVAARAFSSEYAGPSNGISCAFERFHATVSGLAPPLVQIDSVRLVKSPSEGVAVEIAGATMDINLNDAAQIALNAETFTNDIKATMKAAKGSVKAKSTKSSDTAVLPMRVVVMDSSLRTRCAVAPYSTFGRTPEDARRQPDDVECGFEFACPLAEITKTNATMVKVATGGFSVTMFDTIQETQMPPTAAEDQLDDWVERRDYEGAANETHRVMLVGGFNVDYEKIDKTYIKVAFDTIDFDWEPDAQFLALELASLAKAAKANGKTSSAPASKVKSDTVISLDFRNVHGSVFLTPGACGMVSFAEFNVANTKSKACRASGVKLGVNGYVITTMDSVSIDASGASSRRTSPHVEAITYETAHDVDLRKKTKIDIGTMKCMLPVGLDLGDALVAGMMGYDAFLDVKQRVAKAPKKLRVSMSKDDHVSMWASTTSAPVNELDLNVTNIEITAEDSNTLERFLRAKQAALGASIAAAAFQPETKETLEKLASLYTKHSEFLANGGGSALRIEMGSLHTISVYGGGKGDGDELTSKAAEHVRRVDAPYSDSTALQMQNAFSMRTNVHDMRVNLADVDERPVLSCSEATLSGTFVQARMHVPQVKTAQVPIQVGRRRWTMVNGPDTPSRPTIMWYTDAKFDLVDAEMFYATCMEPYMFNASQEMQNRMLLPRRHKLAPGGGGGRPPVVEYSAANPKPAGLPAWDNIRNQWRGLMTITATKSRVKFDTQGQIEYLGAHGGAAFASELELAADAWDIRLEPKCINVRCAHFTASRIQDDEEITEAGTPRASEPSPHFNIMTIPVMNFEAKYAFTSVNGLDGHRTHHRYDSRTGEVLIEMHETRSIDCALTTKTTMFSKEEFLLQHAETASSDSDEFIARVRRLSSVPPQFGATMDQTFSNPTLALTPEDVAWMLKWKKGAQKPMVAFRNVWKLRPWGHPRKVSHPDSKSLTQLIGHVDMLIKAKTFNIFNSSCDETDIARGAVFALQALDCSVRNEFGKETEFALRSESVQFHVPEHEVVISRQTSVSPARVYRSSSLNNRLNVNEMDDVIKEMLLGSTAMSPSASESASTGGKSPKAASAARATSTDATLVFDSRRFEIIRKVDDSVANQGVQIEVDAPRILIEAEKRNAILGWIRDVWAAANSQAREPSMTELERIVSSAHKSGDVKTYRAGHSQEHMESLIDSSLRGDATSPRKLRMSEDSDQPKRTPDTRVLFVINVTAPQINFKGNDAAGRMLLAAEGGLVVGRRVNDGQSSTEAPRRLVTVSLQQVQAHVAPTNVDLNAGVQWLKEQKSGSDSFTVRDDVFNAEDRAQSGSLLRRIFTPGAMVFEYSTVVSASVSSVADADMYAYDEPEIGSPSQKKKTSSSELSSGEAMSEFSVRSPEIEAEMNSSQYVVLIDVMASLFLTPTVLEPPRPSSQAATLLRSRDRTLFEGDALASAAIVAKPMMNLIKARWRAESAEQNYLRALWMSPNEKKRVLERIDEYWRAASKAEKKVLNAVHAATEFVRLYRRRAAIRLNLQIEYAAWTLVDGGKAFMSAELSRLSLSRERQIDSSGVMRFKLHGLTLVSLGQENKSEDLVALSRWAPSEKSANMREPLIDLFVIRAGSAPEAPMYDHLELSVQPFAVHVTRQLYSRIYKYLFPEPKKRAHDKFEEAFKRVKALSAPAPETVNVSDGGNSIDPLSVNRKARHLAPLDIPSATASPARRSKRKWTWHDGERVGGDVDADGVNEDDDGGANNQILAPSEPRGIDHKIVVLRHFRIHPLHMNVTYEGKTASLHDSHIVLDAFSYENFRGRWRDLTSELKSHLVWSVLKSFTGFRGRYVESKIDDQAIIENTTKRKKRQQSGTEDASMRDITSEIDIQRSSGGDVEDEDEDDSDNDGCDEYKFENDDDDGDFGIPAASPSLTSASTKPRRVRPVKNIKKFFKLGKYKDGASRTRGDDKQSRDDVLNAWASSHT